MVSVKMFKKTTGWTHTKKYNSSANNTGKRTRGPTKGNQNEHQSMTQIRAQLKDVNYVWEELLRGRRFNTVKYTSKAQQHQP